MFFKCKMCGGDLDINQEMRICECQYCGSKQTLPKLGNDKRNNMFDRAGHFRRNNEYDKAMSLYEQILSEEAEDAEVYWSLVLCRYGIEYVEDPVSYKRMPTVNRAQFQSILADEDYKSALKYADEQQRAIYEEEAKEIEQIQKGILAISNKEEPFDVFICYKESDESGRRTPDSVLANDLYHQLIQEGFKVFFARLTLEDKLGSAYEPYIFAALNSAKVMVVLGTRPEYFNAVWVKNEWSRYLSMIKSGESKVLIPAYKDMDPYDLPEAFAHLQAQDMSKLGFMQDLIRGIKKLANKEQKTEPKQVETVSAGNGVQALVERAFLFLEDGDFTRADELCEQALNQNPKNAKAYVGKLMAERKVTKQEELSSGAEELTKNNYFQKALRFAEDGLKRELERCNQMIMDRNKDRDYESALELVKQSGVSSGVEAAINMLTQAINKYENLLGWKDSEAKLNECREQKEKIIKEIYEKSRTLQKESGEKKITVKEAVQKLEAAIEGYNSIARYRNVDDVLKICQANLNRLHMIKKFKQSCKVAISLIVCVSVMVVVNSIYNFVQWKQRYDEAYAEVEKAVEEGDYEEAVSVAGEEVSKEEVDSLFYKLAKEKMKDGEYEVATILFENITNYKDTEEQIYQLAIQFMESGEYERAIELFDSISEHNGSAEQKQEATYRLAMQYIESEEYEAAAGLFESIPDYKDTKEQIYKPAIEFMQSGRYERAIELFSYISEYKDSAEQKQEATYQLAVQYIKSEEYEEAVGLFESILDYKDTKEINYQCAIEMFQKGKFDTAENIFRTIPEYRDSTVYAELFDWAKLEYSNSEILILTENKEMVPEQIVIPSGVTQISSKAFELCTNLTNIIIPDSVTSIGDYAFYGCNNLTSVTIPDSVTSIGDYAFYRCNNLTSVTVPGSVASVGDGAFKGCTELTSVTLSDGVIGIGKDAFYECSNLVNVIIPDSVTSIGASAFMVCTSLTSITIPNSVTVIDTMTFYGCTSLTSVIIPDSVTKIYNAAFKNCTSLKSVTISNSVTWISNEVFMGCTNLTSVTIPDSVTSIGDHTFAGCTNLTNVTIPDDVGVSSRLWIMP